VVTGIATNCCVSTTIRDAADIGYSVVVVEECTGDYDRVTHETAIKGLFFNFARIVMTVDEALAAIDARATV
jgi:nicotinamidase-related amidase